MKDPAFLFYSNDFLSGTMLMSDEDVGKYIRLMCLQHQKGHLKEKDMLSICKEYNEDVYSKFKKDDEGKYYNERLEYEANKRKAYSESRRNNRKKKDMLNISETYVKHMENENEIENINNEEEDSKGEETKQCFAKFVSMTNAEYKKLCSTHGKDFTEQCISKLNNYKGANGKKYKSDYRAILSWVVASVEEENKKKSNSLEFNKSSNKDWDVMYDN